MGEGSRVIIKKKAFIGLLVIVLVVGSLAGAMIFNGVATGWGKGVLISKQDLAEIEKLQSRFGKLNELYDKLESSYYSDLDKIALNEGMYKGLYNAVGDPYTTYLTADEYESLMAATTGDFYGIGVVIASSQDGKYIEVISTIEDSPAERIGIKTGDIILAVDGNTYTGKELDIAASAMRGSPGTSVKVKYSSKENVEEVTLIRSKIVTKSVDSTMLEGDIGYIRVTSFESATGEDFEKELRKMELQSIKGLIIDLRNNGGGIVDGGVKMADLLLPEGNIVYLEDHFGNKEYWNSDSNSTEIPYVILVNEGTASTSEIVTAAVKDNKGGKIVGTNTYGKGIVQNVVPLADGSAVRITVKQYFSPNGNTIHNVGIEPDYVVGIQGEGENIRDTQLEKALELLP